MPPIRQIDIKLINELFGMESGYVLDFSNASISDFFTGELGIDFDDPQFSEDGPSKAKRLRCLLRKVDAATAARVLEALWPYREPWLRNLGRSDTADAHARFLRLLERIQNSTNQGFHLPPTPPAAFAALKLEDLEAEFSALHTLYPQQRGFAFEKFLTKLFNASGLAARSPFKTVGEQIDGSFELHKETYLLEAKWQNEPTPVADLYIFKSKVEQRAKWARGLFISYSGFTEDGLWAYGRGGPVMLLQGKDIHEILNRRIPWNRVLEYMARNFAETGTPLVPLDSFFQR